MLLRSERIRLGLLADLVFCHFAVLAGNRRIACGSFLGDAGKLLDLDGLVVLFEIEQNGLEDGLKLLEGQKVEEKGLRGSENALIALQGESFAGEAVVFPA